MMKMMSHKTKMRHQHQPRVRRRKVDVMRLQRTLIRMSPRQPMHRGRRRQRVDVTLHVEVALTMKLRVMTQTEEKSLLEKKAARKEVVVIVVVIVSAIVTKVATIVRIRSAEEGMRKKEEIVIERRSVVVGMRKTPVTAMPRSVDVKEMTVMVNGMSAPLRSRKGKTEIGEIVVTVIVVIVIGIEVRVKREGDENEA